jgi:deoxyribose-phosphate aldolase
MNISQFKMKNYDTVVDEINQIIKNIPSKITVKVIVEISKLNKDECLTAFDVV